MRGQTQWAFCCTTIVHVVIHNGHYMATFMGYRLYITYYTVSNSCPVVYRGHIVMLRYVLHRCIGELLRRYFNEYIIYKPYNICEITPYPPWLASSIRTTTLPMPTIAPRSTAQNDAGTAAVCVHVVSLPSIASALM